MPRYGKTAPAASTNRKSTYNRTSTKKPAWREAQANQRERFRAMAKNVSEMTEEARNAIIDRIGLMPTASGKLLSKFNTLLVVSQCPNATQVGGYNQWQEIGRQVKKGKGEKGIAIFFPTAGKKTEDPETDDGADKISFYMRACMFDIRQTAPIDVETSENATTANPIVTPEENPLNAETVSEEIPPISQPELHSGEDNTTMIYPPQVIIEQCPLFA